MKLYYNCAVSDMPFNCQDGGEEVEEESEGGRAHGSVAGGKGAGVSCSAHCTLHTSHCTLQGTRPVCS